MYSQSWQSGEQLKTRIARQCVELFCERYQVTTESVLKNTQVSRELWNSPSFNINQQHIIQIFKNFMAISGNDDLGLWLGREMNIFVLKELAFILIASSNLWESTEFILREVSKNARSFSFKTQILGRYAQIELATSQEARVIEKFLTDLIFSFIHNLMQYLKIQGQEQIEFHFRFQPGRKEEYFQQFYVPIFGADSNRIILPEVTINHASPFADPKVVSQTIDYCSRTEFPVDQIPLDEKIRQILNRSEFDFPSLEEVAEEINIAPWTLARKLKSMGSSYQQILDEIRMQRAAFSLTHSSDSVTEISQRLGYSDVSSFRRAFKRWTQISPKDYRKTYS